MVKIADNIMNVFGASFQISTKIFQLHRFFEQTLNLKTKFSIMKLLMIFFFCFDFFNWIRAFTYVVNYQLLFIIQFNLNYPLSIRNNQWTGNKKYQGQPCPKVFNLSGPMFPSKMFSFCNTHVACNSFRV